MSATLIRHHLVIRGAVQGVWFRASTRDAAQRAGATGWVRNRIDGTVEAEVQGTQAQVESVEAFCRVGPPLARVTEVNARPIAVREGEQGFAVR